VILCVCLSFQYCTKDSQIELPKGAVVSGDSAYYPEVFAQMRNNSFVGKDDCFPSFDSLPKVLKSVKVFYPKEAVKTKTEGDIKVKAWIDEKGIPRLAIISESSNKIFNEQSLIATMNTLFTPAIMDKKPKATWIFIPYKFRLQ
jgi:TonB family protein